MNITTNKLLNLIVILVTLLLTGLPNSFANDLNNTLTNSLKEGEILTEEGYPYKMLIKRTSQVKLMYKGTDNITCRVEVTYKQQTWVGREYNTKPKKFATKPLGECMDRDLAKEILKATF